MNSQFEQILSETEIQNNYERLQTQLKQSIQFLKLIKDINKDFSKATFDYGEKLEEIAKKSMPYDYLKVNISKIIGHIGYSIKSLGSQIMGTSSAIKELIIPITNHTKEFKNSYNEYVRMTCNYRKEYEEAYRKLDEIKQKIAVQQKSVLPTEKHSSALFRQLRQQEDKADCEQKIKCTYLQKCKYDLSSFIVEESNNILALIQTQQSKLLEYILNEFLLYNEKLNKIAPTSQIQSALNKSASYSSRSITPSKRKSSKENHTIKSFTSHTPSQRAISERSQSILQENIQQSKWSRVSPIKQTKSKSPSIRMEESQFLTSEEQRNSQLRIKYENKENQSFNSRTAATKQRSKISSSKSKLSSLYQCDGLKSAVDEEIYEDEDYL